MIFSKKHKQYLTRELKTVSFVEKLQDPSLVFPNKFCYNDGTMFNVKDNGMSNMYNQGSTQDIIAEINKPEVYIPNDISDKPKYDRIYLNYEYHIDNLFNIIRCDYDKPSLSVNTFAKDIAKEAYANDNYPEFEFEDGEIGTIIKSIEITGISNKLIDKIKFLSKSIDIELEGISTWANIL